MNSSQRRLWKWLAGIVLFGVLLWVGFAFFSEKEITPSSEVSNVSSEVHQACSAKSREAQVCLALYAPVCGWFASNVQCVKAPCATTYSNSCFACQNANVADWTEGECPAS